MNPIVDFSYLEDMAEGKAEFVKQVLSIFMDNTPKGLKELEAIVAKGDSFEKIQKQAHFLKSSFGIVKVDQIHQRLQKIESLAREQKDKEEIHTLTNEITDLFKEAEILIKDRMK